jgi:hypothetical protein
MSDTPHNTERLLELATPKLTVGLLGTEVDSAKVNIDPRQAIAEARFAEVERRILAIEATLRSLAKDKANAP